MAEAATKTTESTRSVTVLVKLIKTDLVIAERRSPDVWRRIGGYLVDLKKQVPRGRWGQFIRDNFEFTERHAIRLMKFYSDRMAARGSTRLSDTDPSLKKNPGHYSKAHTAFREEAEKVRAYRERVAGSAPPKLRTFSAAAADRSLEREIAERFLAIGYRTLSTELHPDKGGSDREMAILTRVRDGFRRCMDMRWPTTR